MLDEFEEGGVPVGAEDTFVVPVSAGYEDALRRRLWDGEAGMVDALVVVRE